MTLNENEVKKQLKNMQEFIALEAREKVEEIDAKAEEEFQIEKSKLVQNQRLKIMDYYSKKEKKLDLAKKILDSNLMNQSRIKVLQSREEHVQMLLKEAKDKLRETTRNTEVYKKTVEGLLIQGLFQLLETKVIVHCLKKDEDLVKSVLPEAKSAFKQSTQKECEVQISPSYLNDSISGGIEITDASGKIRIVNTLESRLDQISDCMMPQIREILFGPNTNRKFRD